jgi:hypothetical protein
MSAWRRVAIEKFPKLEALIAKSESVGMLWTELWFVFCEAHKEPIDEATIRGIYEFARWTYKESRNSEIATSTVCHFYEHLPLKDSVKKLLPKFMSRQEVLELSDVFKYHLSEVEHKNFIKEFAGEHKKLK